jgi:hypothetical protein
MGNRRFEMHTYRHILVRMRQGESDRQLAKDGIIGRNKAAELRNKARQQGLLAPDKPLPDDEQLAAILTRPASSG